MSGPQTPAARMDRPFGMTEEEERGTEGGVKIRDETNEEERKEWKGLQKKTKCAHS